MLDSVGFESGKSNLGLELLLDQARQKVEGIPLTALTKKMKDVAGMMPILKQVVNR